MNNCLSATFHTQFNTGGSNFCTMHFLCVRRIRNHSVSEFLQALDIRIVCLVQQCTSHCLFIWPIKHFVQESLYNTSATLSSKSHQNHVVVVVIIQVPIQLLIVMLQKFGRAATYSISNTKGEFFCKKGKK